MSKVSEQARRGDGETRGRGDSPALPEEEGRGEGRPVAGSAGVPPASDGGGQAARPTVPGTGETARAPRLAGETPALPAYTPKKRRHGPPKQAFVLLALIVAAAAWWLYTQLTTVPANGITASGTIESEEVNVASEVPGRIVQLLADEGDIVQENQLLAKIDDSTLQLQFRMASSEAERQLTQLQISKTSIRAPMAGAISRRSVRAGEVTSAGATMMVITSTDPVDLTLYVPERFIGQVKVGQSVDVRVDSFPGQGFPGRVTFISTKAEFTPRNVQTQKDRMNLVFAVKVQIPNADGRLKPGMPADATISGTGVGGQGTGTGASAIPDPRPLSPGPTG